MDPNENIPAESPSDLHTTESQDHIPVEIWIKILSFLPFDDRCRVEGVNHQLSDASKTSWAQLQLKSLSIASPMVDSAAKLATLLRRCGSHLEEIIVGRHIQLDTEAQLFRLCPNVQVLSFTDGKSLSLSVSGKNYSQRSFATEAAALVQSFLESMPNLKCLQFFREVYSNNWGGENRIIKLSDVVFSLAILPNLQELHLPIRWAGDQHLRHIVDLKKLRVLSITDPAVDMICQLRLLEQLYIQFSTMGSRFFNTQSITRLAKSLPKLNSLVLVRGCYWDIPVGYIDAIISQFAQLRTLVIVCPNQRLEGNSDGPVPVDLSQHHYRQVPLNIFVADYSQPDVPFHSNFTGYSPQINIVSMPNDRYGEAIDFLSTYSQNGFDFGAQKCLQMVKMSSQFNGQWDFSNEHSDSISNRTN